MKKTMDSIFIIFMIEQIIKKHGVSYDEAKNIYYNELASISATSVQSQEIMRRTNIRIKMD
jgi:hypothetical protein